MPRFLKILLRVILVLAGLFVVAAVAVPLLVPAEKFGRMAADRIERETGATVEFGEIGFSVWPRLKLVVRDCEVRGTGAAMAERTGRESSLVEFAVAAGRIDADIAIGPLLRRRVEAGSIRLASPRVEVVTAIPAGEEGGRGAAAASVGGAAPAMALMVGGVSIVDGSVQWRDMVSGRSADVAGWSQEVSLSEVGTLVARLRAFAAAAPAPQLGEDPSRLEMRAVADSLRLAGFAPERPEPLVLAGLDLRLELTVPPAADRIDFEIPAASWGEVELSASGQAVPAGEGRMNLNGSWRLADIDLAALARDLPAAVSPPPGAAADWLASEPVSGGELSAAAGNFDLDLPLPDEAGPADLLRGIDGAAEVRGLTFAPPRDLPAVAADAGLSLAAGVLRLAGVKAACGGGVLTGDGSLDYASDPRGVFSFAAECRDLPVAVLLRPYAAGAADVVEGTAGGKLRGGGVLGEKAEILESLAVDGDMILTEGVLHGTDLLSGVSKYLGDRQDLKEIRYKELLHHVQVVDGRYYLRDLELKGRDTDWRGEGSIGFAGDLDLDLSVKLPADFTPDLGDMTAFADALRGEDGRIRLDMHLSGPARRPAVKLKLDLARTNVTETVTKGIKGWLDKLKGGK